MKRVHADESVVIGPAQGPDLAIDCPCYPLALAKLNRGVEDMEQRVLDTNALLGLELDLPARIAIMKRYGVRYIVLRPGSPLVHKLREIYRPMLAHQYNRTPLVL